MVTQPGALAGDIVFRVNLLPHETFGRNGADLYVTRKISLLQSLTGVTFATTLLDGEEITCSTPPGEVISNRKSVPTQWRRRS